MRIEEIKPSQRKKGRILVKLSDGSILRLTEDVVLSYGLRPGEELGEDRLAALRSDAAAAVVKTQAAEIVGSRALSRRELERKLQRRGAAPGAVQGGDQPHLHIAGLGVRHLYVAAHRLEKAVVSALVPAGRDALRLHDDDDVVILIQNVRFIHGQIYLPRRTEAECPPLWGARPRRRRYFLPAQ